MAIRDRLPDVLPAFAVQCILVSCLVLRLWPERQCIGHIAKGALYRLAPCLKPPEDDPFERRVREECMKRRLERAPKVLLTLLAVMTVQAATSFLEIVRGDPIVGRVPFYLASMVIASFALMPRLITRKTIDAIYVVGLLTLIVPIAVEGRDFKRVHGWEYQATAMALPWSVFNTRVWLNACMNAVLYATIVSATDAMSITDGLRTHIVQMILYICLDHAFERAVRLELGIQDSSIQLSAIHTLLTNICDVVIELNSGLRLTQHSTKLADLLFQGPLRSLTGAELQEFMPEEADRESFAEQMRGSDEAAEHTAVFHTALRDGVGGTIRMELFAVAFRGADDRRRHILGMREFTDIEPMTGGRRGPQTVVDLPRERPDARNGPGTPASLERNDVASLGGSSAASSETGASGSAHPEASAKPARIETVDVVMKSTLMSGMDGWYVAPLDGLCCPWHAVVDAGYRILDEFAKGACDKQWGKRRSWQCRNCGIMDKEFKRKKRSHNCNLCRDIPERLFRPSDVAQTTSPMSL